MHDVAHESRAIFYTTNTFSITIMHDIECDSCTTSCMNCAQKVRYICHVLYVILVDAGEWLLYALDRPALDKSVVIVQMSIRTLAYGRSEEMIARTGFTVHCKYAVHLIVTPWVYFNSKGVASESYKTICDLDVYNNPCHL